MARSLLRKGPMRAGVNETEKQGNDLPVANWSLHQKRSHSAIVQALQALDKPDWFFLAIFVGGALAAIASVTLLLVGLSWID
jgi:hypothetical protein